MINRALVVRNTGSSFLVENLVDHTIHDCRIKGNFRIKEIRTTNPIAVGDVVEYIEGKDGSDGLITKIEQRKNYIIRRSINLSKEAHIIAANLDNVFLTVTLCSPNTSFEFIDRFLVTCEVYKVPVIILLNKSDLYRKEDIDYFVDLYTHAGYEVIVTSTTDNCGIDVVKQRMRGKISLFSGNSGVGKSTIIKSIAPDLDIKIGEISEVHHKGKHTTTFSQMFKLDENSYLVDTPGIKGFGLIDVGNNELAMYFPDLFKYAHSCQYTNCTHTHEPRCKVKEMVENSTIAIERYTSYLSILEDEDEKGKYR